MNAAHWLAALAILMGACAPSAQPTPTGQPSARRTAAILGPTETANSGAGLPFATPHPSPSPLPTFIPIPPVSSADWVRGADRAAVTLLAYADFQSAACAEMASLLEQVLANHPNEVRWVFRHYPLAQRHDKAVLAGQAAELAGEQGAFWEMHDLLFARLNEWAPLSVDQFSDWLLQAAAGLELQMASFQAGLTGGRFEADLQAAFSTALGSGIPGAPFLFINGVPFRLPVDLKYLEASVRVEALKERQYTDPPPFVLDLDSSYLAHLQLDIGEIVVQLYPQSAPLAVNSFLFLAGEGWFDGNIIYRVVPGSYVESGDPTATGFGEAGYQLPTELDATLDFSRPGMVALSASGPEIQGSRFMITLAPRPDLTGTRTIFGRVISGLTLLQDLAKREPIDDLLAPAGATIEGITIEVRS